MTHTKSSCTLYSVHNVHVTLLAMVFEISTDMSVMSGSSLGDLKGIVFVKSLSVVLHAMNNVDLVTRPRPIWCCFLVMAKWTRRPSGGWDVFIYSVLVIA